MHRSYNRDFVFLNVVQEENSNIDLHETSSSGCGLVYEYKYERVLETQRRVNEI